MGDEDDWETAWDSGAAEARLTADNENLEKLKQKNKELWHAANVPTPEIHYSHAQKTVYKPDLQILKRPTQSPSPKPSTPTLSKQEEEALRIERERKYEEARGRIFGTPSSVIPSASIGEKKVWDPKEKERDRGVLPVRAPKGPGSGRGFAPGRGRGRDS